jgi:hypothetical protein
MPFGIQFGTMQKIYIAEPIALRQVGDTDGHACIHNTQRTVELYGDVPNVVGCRRCCVMPGSIMCSRLVGLHTAIRTFMSPGELVWRAVFGHSAGRRVAISVIDCAVTEDCDSAVKDREEAQGKVESTNDLHRELDGGQWQETRAASFGMMMGCCIFDVRICAHHSVLHKCCGFITTSSQLQL